MGDQAEGIGGGADVSRVLIVDDNHELTDLFAIWLDDGYDVHTAYGGEEALEAFRQEGHAIDAVLLDRRMPDLHGDMVLVALRDAGFDCPIALVTAVHPDFDILGKGFDDYVQKPVSREGLLETVENLIGLDSYETLRRDLSSKRVLRNVLRGEKSGAELECSDAFGRLEREIGRLERRLERHYGHTGTGQRRSA